jgi:transposase-like protein
MGVGDSSLVAGERHTRAFWRRLSAAVDRGASIASTAQRHGVRPKTLTWWRWMLRREEKKRPGAKRRPAKLLPVVVRAEATRETAWGTEPIAIAVGNEVALRVPVGSDVGYVAALVAAVRKTC